MGCASVDCAYRVTLRVIVGHPHTYQRRSALNYIEDTEARCDCLQRLVDQ